MALRVVVMGVSGCGKSTVGLALAQRLALRFVEGDALHPPENVARMAAGTPLTDEDRQAWLTRVATVLRDGEGDGVVVTCSALKRTYRDRLRATAPDLQLVFLHTTPAVLAERLQRRRGHYMPASLLQSQLQALQPPSADEAALELDAELPVTTLTAAAEQYLRATRP